MHGFSKYKASALALIAANALPLVGVLFWQWDAFEIVALYWAENVVIGAINVLKMITCNPNAAEVDAAKLVSAEQLAKLENWSPSDRAKSSLAHHASKLFFIPFFTFHYGLFCVGHGVFVVTFFGNESMAGGGLLDEFGQTWSAVFAAQLGWAVAALAASHLYSFAVNYLGRGEYRRTFVPVLMFQPYGRIVVLHIAIVIGGIIAMALGNNIAILLVLVVGKTVLDLGLHLWERRLNAAGDEALTTV